MDENVVRILVAGTARIWHNHQRNQRTGELAHRIRL